MDAPLLLNDGLSMPKTPFDGISKKEGDGRLVGATRKNNATYNEPPKIYLETIPKHWINRLFAILYLTLFVSCILCMLELNYLKRSVLGTHICSNSIKHNSVTYVYGFDSFSTWYSLNFVAHNVSIESAQKDFSYELQMKTVTDIGKKEISYVKHKNIQSFAECSLRGDAGKRCSAELIVETSLSFYVQQCSVVGACTASLTFTVFDKSLCDFSLEGSRSSLPLAIIKQYVLIFCSLFTLLFGVYWLHIFKCNYCRFRGGKTRKMESPHEQKLLLFLFPAMLLLQYPDDTEDYIHQVSTNVLFRKIDAIRRPLGLAFVLLFWLCFIDSGHQIKTRHTSLGFWFYFPKVLVCSSVWAALSAYAYFHDIPHNNADIRRYLDNSNFFVYLGVLLLVLYLSLVMMSCQRTRRLLQNVPYHTARKEQMVFSFVALCSLGLVLYLPVVVFIALKETHRENLWKFIQRLALGYPTVFLISIYTFIVAYVYLPPGPNDVRRKWIIKESMGLTRMRSNFIFDNQNCLVGATKTSGRGNERNVFNNFDLSENEIDTAELENSDIGTSQRCIMTFSSFCLETALEMVEAAYLSYFDAPDESRQQEIVSMDKDAVNLHLTAGSFGPFGPEERKRLLATNFEVCGSVYDENTKCYVVVLRRNGRIVVSFRGTSNITHWRKNCDCFKQQPIDWLDADAILAREGIELFFPPLVHSGFKDMFLNIRVKLMEILKSLIENKDEQSHYHPWHIFLTGHSLGVSFAFFFCFFQGYLTSQISSFINMLSG